MTNSLQANRLSDADRRVMTDRCLSVVRGWRDAVAGYRPGYGDLPSLERVAVHSIGCSFADLRDVELEEIAMLVAELAGLEPIVR